MHAQLFPTYNLKNISRYYYLTIFMNGWFTTANWVFLFARYISQKEIGLVEGIAVLIGILMEVPSGVVADMIGKVKSLILGNALLVICCFVIYSADNYTAFLIGNIIMFLGFAFNSGANEALLYDSLKEKNLQKHYDQIIGKTNALKITTTLITTGIGGLLYRYSPTLPFVAWGIFSLISICILTSVKEPKIDTFKASFKEYFALLSNGVRSLFNVALKPYLITLFTLSSIVILSHGLVRQSTAAYFGYNGETFGYLYTLVTIPAILISTQTSFLRQKIGTKALLLLPLLLLLLGYTIASGSNSAWFGALVFLLLNISEYVSAPVISSVINENIDSRHRATTLSTLSLFSQIPYIILVSFFATLVEIQNIPTLMLGYAIFLGLVWAHTAVFVRN